MSTSINDLHIPPRLSKYIKTILKKDDSAEITACAPLGLKRGLVHICKSNDEWPELFNLEKLLLQQALGESLIDIRHIGSTSIPGLMSKPIIDVLIGVKTIKDEETLIEKITGIGYDYAGNDIVPENLIFGLGKLRTHILHVTEFNGNSWQECLRFKSLLRSNPLLRHYYENHKLELASKFRNDRLGYSDAKSDIVKQILK